MAGLSPGGLRFIGGGIGESFFSSKPGPTYSTLQYAPEGIYFYESGEPYVGLINQAWNMGELLHPDTTFGSPMAEKPRTGTGNTKYGGPRRSGPFGGGLRKFVRFNLKRNRTSGYAGSREKVIEAGEHHFSGHC